MRRHLPSVLLTVALLLMFGVAGAADQRPLTLADLSLLALAGGLCALSRAAEHLIEPAPGGSL